MVIDCHIRYFNDWSTWSPASAVKYEIEFAPSSQQNALYSSTYEAVGFGDARMMVKRSGVYVRVLQEGNLERFSLVEMLQTLAIGFMLMTLSSSLILHPLQALMLPFQKSSSSTTLSPMKSLPDQPNLSVTSTSFIIMALV